MARHACLIAALALLAAGSAHGEGPATVLPPPGTLVAHALGGIGGVDYTSSREALALACSRGFRWFETDVARTSDGELVCVHEGLEPLVGLSGRVQDLTLEQVLSTRLYQAYTPFSLKGLLHELQARPDTYLFLDTKRLTARMLAAVEAAVADVDPALRRRLLIECYSGEDLELARQAQRDRGPFAAVVLASYAADLPPGELVRLVETTRVSAVLLPRARFNRELTAALRQAGAQVIVHAVNDCNELPSLGEAGVSAVMTDFCTPTTPQ